MLLTNYNSIARIENVEGKHIEYEQAAASHVSQWQAIPD
jgi:DNA-dependent RNA polymerase auxiliary subunit epsilon